MPRPLGCLVVLLLLPVAGWADGPKPRLDADGDPLPDGALARVGARRLRHGGSAIIVAFAPDGKALASAGNDGLVRLWETATGREIRRFDGHKGNVDGLAFAPDGKTLLSSGTDGTARLWEVATGKERRAQSGNRGSVNAVAFAPDGKTFATKATNGTAQIWDVTTGKELQWFSVASDEGTSNLTFAPDGKALALVGSDSKPCLMDTATGRDIRKFAGHTANVNSLAFSRDGKVLASAGNDGLARLWDVATGKELRQLRGHEGPVAAVRFSPDGKTAATAGIDRTVRLWDVETGKELRHWAGHTATVSEVAFSPDGKVLASASWDQTVRLWDPATGKELPQSARSSPVTCAALSADGKLLVTGDKANDLRLWDPATGKPLPRVLEFDGPVTALALSSDGKLIAAGSQAGRFGVWEADTGKARFVFVDRVKRLVPDSVAVSVLAFTPDSRALAAVRNQLTALAALHDTTSGLRLRALFPDPPDDGTGSTIHFPPHALLFAPDGRSFITASTTGGVVLHDASTGRALRQLIDDSRLALGGIALSPDGRALATAAEGGRVHLWETTTGGRRRAFGADGEWASAAALSADGKLLAGSGPGGAVRVWQVATGRELRSFRGHESAVTALSFSADGKLLSLDNAVALIWDASGLKPVPPDRPAELDGDAAWDGLAGGGAARAYEAITRLAAAPEEAVALLRGRLKPADTSDVKRVEGLIAKLDDDEFAEREKAMRELENLGGRGEGALRKAAKAPPSAEVARRVADLLQKIEGGARSGEAVRQTRALEVLEGIGTPEAKKLLEELAKGAPDAALTQEAKASLGRLAKRAAAP